MDHRIDRFRFNSCLVIIYIYIYYIYTCQWLAICVLVSSCAFMALKISLVSTFVIITSKISLATTSSARNNY